jgi:cytochrome b
MLKVWDPLVRIVHWSVAALVVIDLVNEAGANPWHRGFGYAALALVALRLAWGFVGTAPARLATMLRSAARVREYLGRGSASRVFAGHNPLGALMAFALWALVIACGVTGWLLQLDRYWGDETLQRLHAAIAYALAAFAALHVAGALITSLRTRARLVTAMITGVKRIENP